MSAESNKQLVAEVWKKFSAGNLDDAMAMLSDTATWWISGEPEKFPLAGTKTKAQFAEIAGGATKSMRKGLRVTPTAFTAEGDRVAVEATSYGEMNNGKVYKNLYHFLFVIREGKIQEVREYLDTIHANYVLVEP